MKESILILFCLGFVIPVDIKSVYTKDSFNELLYPPSNPINGTDYWKSREICCEDFAEWTIELTEETYIYIYIG
jgi:hypothetical protein